MLGRLYTVYLPPDYYESGDRYPVLYMLDGETVFRAGEPSWHAERVADSLIGVRAIRPIIIVAVHGPGDDSRRTWELTPWPDLTYVGGTSGGGGEHTLEEMMLDLKPTIDRQYRTLASRDATWLSGASLGGLLAIYAGYAHGAVFGRVAAFSPSYWWSHYQILAFASLQGRGTLERLYHDTGTHHDNSAAGLLALEELALSQGFVPDADILTVVVQNGTHSIASWRGRLPAMLQFLTSTVSVASLADRGGE